MAVAVGRCAGSPPAATPGAGGSQKAIQWDGGSAEPAVAAPRGECQRALQGPTSAHARLVTPYARLVTPNPRPLPLPQPPWHAFWLPLAGRSGAVPAADSRWPPAVAALGGAASAPTPCDSRPPRHFPGGGHALWLPPVPAAKPTPADSRSTPADSRQERLLTPGRRHRPPRRWEPEGEPWQRDGELAGRARFQAPSGPLQHLCPAACGSRRGKHTPSDSRFVDAFCRIGEFDSRS